MSNEIKFRQQQRMRKRKQKIRQTLFLSASGVILLTLLVLCVSGIISHNKNKSNIPPQFIFNGYVYPQPLEKHTDMLLDLDNNDGVKTAYLTFDDGPNNSVTVQVLDVLRRYNIKATFFMVGTLIEKNPQVARRIYDEGHCLANHSYSHNYSELYADAESFMNQINKTQELIGGVVNKENYPKIFRFPGGGYNAGSHGEAKQSYKTLLEENGFKYCDWNSLSGDAESTSPSEAYVLERIKTTTGTKEDVVILMHDALAKSVTAKSLPDCIDYLIQQGYTFDTLDNI